MVEKDLSWEVVQVKDTITPGNPHYNAKSHLAKTVRFGDGRQDCLGRRAGRRRAASAPTANEQHELHRLPLVVEPELLRLPPAAEGEPEDAAACTTRAT